MDIFLLLLLGVLLVLGIYGVLLYNGLVRLKHGVSKAWSNIDVLLKQRHDELPKLVETCKQYMQFERDTLERIMRARAAVSDARARADVAGVGAAESELRLGLGNLFAVAEAYPELMSNQQFRHLQARISELENGIADRREIYNESVNNNNVRIEQFPDLIVARLFGFKASPLLKFEAEQIRDPDMKKLFG